MTRYARLKKDFKCFPAELTVSVDVWIDYTIKLFKLSSDNDRARMISLLRTEAFDYVLTFGEQTVILKCDESTDLLEFLDEAPTE